MAKQDPRSRSLQDNRGPPAPHPCRMPKHNKGKKPPEDPDQQLRGLQHHKAGQLRAGAAQGTDKLCHARTGLKHVAQASFGEQAAVPPPARRPAHHQSPPAKRAMPQSRGLVDDGSGCSPPPPGCLPLKIEQGVQPDAAAAQVLAEPLLTGSS